MTDLSQQDYLRDRIRECKRTRRLARAHLALARAEHTINATPETRAALVVCMASHLVAEARCDALEGAR